MKIVKISLRSLLYFGALFALCLGLFSLLNNSENAANVSCETGTEVYYDNYGFRDWMYLRDKNEITHDYTNSNTVYRNRKLIVTSGNYTSVTQSVGYSYTKIKGHEFNAKIKANKKVYEAEVGYKFTSITEETISATLSVPPWKRISLYKSDVCKKTTRVKNFMTEQVFSKLKWKHYQTWGTFGEYVRYYEGFNFDFVEENL